MAFGLLFRLIRSKDCYTTSSMENQPAMTWYACGHELPAGLLGDNFENLALNHIKETMPNLVPTTYEAASAYLRVELKKRKEKRDLHREMCMIIPLDLPTDRKVSLVDPKLKSSFPL